MEIRPSAAHIEHADLVAHSHRESQSSPTTPSHGGTANPYGGYFNQRIKVEAAIGLAVLQFRDGDSGEVEAQFPAAKVVAEYRSHQADHPGHPEEAKGADESGGAAKAETTQPAENTKPDIKTFVPEIV